ncbi:MAG: ABC transporter permease [Chloroflexota bacterium]|nr:ABC transporter permease [Chloroflexota bacterium]
MSVDSTSESRPTPPLASSIGSASAVAEVEPGGLAALVRDPSARAPRSPLQLALLRLRRAKLAIAGMVVISLLALGAIFADYIAPYGADEQDLFNITQPATREHWLGTDELGRDELSRLLYGGRISLLVGVSAALLSAVVGLLVGAIAGYYGGWIDQLLMRFVDLMLAFPAIFLLLIVFSMRGSSVLMVVLFLGFFGWMWLARIIRGEFLSLKAREFVEAAHSIGVPGRRIIVRHLLPNAGGGDALLPRLRRPTRHPDLGQHAHLRQVQLRDLPHPGHRPGPHPHDCRAGHQLRRRRPPRRL